MLAPGDASTVHGPLEDRGSEADGGPGDGAFLGEPVPAVGEGVGVALPRGMIGTPMDRWPT